MPLPFLSIPLSVLVLIFSLTLLINPPPIDDCHFEFNIQLFYYLYYKSSSSITVMDDSHVFKTVHENKGDNLPQTHSAKSKLSAGYG